MDQSPRQGVGEQSPPPLRTTAQRTVDPQGLGWALCLGTLTDPTDDDIRLRLHRARTRGFEGLVLRRNDRWIKVKPHETIDVPITGFIEGRGKHAGRLGIVTTPLGNVGAGFSDEERAQLWAEARVTTLIGQIIEVSCMEFTSTGKFRHPTFIRMRPDKYAS